MNIQTCNFGEVVLADYADLNKKEQSYILKMRNHPEIKKWMYNQTDISEEQHFSFIQSIREDVLKQYFLVKKDDEIVGAVNFTCIDNENKSAFFGFYANPFTPLAGGGRILEEVSIIYAREVLKLTQLSLEVFDENKKVVNLHRKYGFKVVGSKLVQNCKVVCMQKTIEESGA